MDSLTPHTNDPIPWDLVIGSLQGSLPEDEKIRLEDWLESSSYNRLTYERLSKLWDHDIADYAAWEKANPADGWQRLTKMIEGDLAGETGKTSIAPIRKIAGLSIRRLTVAACFLAVTATATLWYYGYRDRDIHYEADSTRPRNIRLTDGSSIELEPLANVDVDAAYNKNTRRLRFSTGTATFTVLHDSHRPFIVDLGMASITDLGTVFTVRKNSDSILVTVAAGKIAFLSAKTGKSLELSAGESACLYTSERLKDQLARTDALRFDETPAMDIISTLEQRLGKHIVVEDQQISDRKLTLHFERESPNEIMAVVAASLNCELSIRDSVYILKKKKAL